MTESAASLLELTEKFLGPEKTLEILKDVILKRDTLRSTALAGETSGKPESVSQFNDATVAARTEMVEPEYLAAHTEIINILRRRHQPGEAVVVLLGVVAEVASLTSPGGMHPEEEVPNFEHTLRLAVEALVTTAVDFRDTHVRLGLAAE